MPVVWQRWARAAAAATACLPVQSVDADACWAAARSAAVRTVADPRGPVRRHPGAGRARRAGLAQRKLGLGLCGAALLVAGGVVLAGGGPA